MGRDGRRDGWEAMDGKRWMGRGGGLWDVTILKGLCRWVSPPFPFVSCLILLAVSNVHVSVYVCVHVSVCACVYVWASFMSAFVCLPCVSALCPPQTKYNKRIYKLFHECFKWFPIATIVNEETLVLHGGISMQPGVTMEDLNAIPRHECKMNT